MAYERRLNGEGGGKGGEMKGRTVTEGGTNAPSYGN